MLKTASQILLGLVLCVAIAIWLIYSPFPLFWEHEDPQPHVYSITWRSGVALLLLLSITQGFSFLVFRLIRLRNRRRPAIPTAAPPSI
jgi:hypothetical protein